MPQGVCAQPVAPPKMTHLHREAAVTRRLYRRNSPALIPAGVSALLMGITAGSSPQSCRLVVVRDCGRSFIGIKLDGLARSVDDVSELDAAYCRWWPCEHWQWRCFWLLLGARQN